jgi:hypothetical protein
MAADNIEYFGIYSKNHPNPKLKFDKNVALYIWDNTGKIGELDYKANNDIIKYYRYSFYSAKNWFGFGFAALPDRNYIDMSRFERGYLWVNLKAKGYIPNDLAIGIKSGSTRDGEAWISDLQNYGFINNGTWHTLKIPIANFVKANSSYFEISQVSQYFMIKSEDVSEPGIIDLNEIFWSSL